MATNSSKTDPTKAAPTGTTEDPIVVRGSGAAMGIPQYASIDIIDSNWLYQQMGSFAIIIIPNNADWLVSAPDPKTNKFTFRRDGVVIGQMPLYELDYNNSDPPYLTRRPQNDWMIRIKEKVQE